MFIFVFGIEFPCLQMIDVIDNHFERSHDVPVEDASAASLMFCVKSDEPYPVPRIKIKVEPEAGPFAVEDDIEGDTAKAEVPDVILTLVGLLMAISIPA